MIHPHTTVRLINEEIGLGVIATQPIPRGTVTWVKDSRDQAIAPGDLPGIPALLRETLDKYCYRDKDGHYVLCWDHAKYMNHSFESNCLLTPYGLEIAVRDIAAGEELTNDYGCFNVIEPFQPCEGHEGRTEVHGDDLRHHHQDWDARILGAVRQLATVPQPMHDLVDAETWHELAEVAQGRSTLRSVATMIHDGDPAGE